MRVRTNPLRLPHASLNLPEGKRDAVLPKSHNCLISKHFQTRPPNRASQISEKGSALPCLHPPFLALALPKFRSREARFPAHIDHPLSLGTTFAFTLPQQRTNDERSNHLLADDRLDR